MVTQQMVNRWCEIGKARGYTPDLADTLWRFSEQLQQRTTTKAALIEMYEAWCDGVEPVEVLPVVVEEMT